MTRFLAMHAGALARAGRLLLVALCAWAGLLSASAQELVKLPPPALVTDLTGTLSADQRKALEGKLHAFEIAHGSQIALVMLPSTQPEDIAAFGNRLGESWKLGRKDVGDGLILIVAKQDKKVRIEVARTLEGAVPDASAKRIIREQLAPAFSQGDFYAGIDHAFDALFRLVEGEGLPAPAAKASGASSSSSDGGLNALIPVVIAAVVLGAFLRAVLGRGGALLAGAGAGGAAWWLVGLPMLFAGGLGLFVAVLVLAMGAGGRVGPIMTGGSHGGWGGGSWGGGGGGGGGSDWGSGGGGDFSGGGASGSWD